MAPWCFRASVLGGAPDVGRDHAAEDDKLGGLVDAHVHGFEIALLGVEQVAARGVWARGNKYAHELAYLRGDFIERGVGDEADGRNACAQKFQEYHARKSHVAGIEQTDNLVRSTVDGHCDGHLQDEAFEALEQLVAEHVAADEA